MFERTIFLACGLDESKELRLQHAFQVRTYTATQFRRLPGSVPSLELCDVYDFRYDIAQPFAPNNEMAYSVFVLPRRRHLSQTLKGGLTLI
jgi:hypothetical protein